MYLYIYIYFTLACLRTNKVRSRISYKSKMQRQYVSTPLFLYVYISVGIFSRSSQRARFRRTSLLPFINSPQQSHYKAWVCFISTSLLPIYFMRSLHVDVFVQLVVSCRVFSSSNLVTLCSVRSGYLRAYKSRF